MINRTSGRSLGIYRLTERLHKEAKICAINVRLLSEEKVLRFQRKSTNRVNAKLHLVWSEYISGVRSSKLHLVWSEYISEVRSSKLHLVWSEYISGVRSSKLHVVWSEYISGVRSSNLHVVWSEYISGVRSSKKLLQACGRLYQPALAARRE